MKRRRPMTKGPWDDPITPLQAARFAKRQTRQEVVDLVHQVCRGRGGEECKLDADKLGEYERGARRPGIEHVTAFCKVFERSPEELGLIRWRNEPAPPGPDTPQPGPATNGTNQTSIRYPEDAESQLLTLSGDMLTAPIALTGQEVPAERELEVSAEVERVQFIKTVGTVAGAVIADPIIAAAQHAHDAIIQTKVSTAEIDRLTDAAYHHARTYYQLTDPSRANELLLDWAAAGRLVALPATHRQRRDLLDAYARLCGILGFLSFDRGEVARANILLETGREAAREADDGSLLAWLYDRTCLTPEISTNDPHHVLKLASQGLQASGRGATLITGRLHSRMGRAYAALGDRRAALDSLDQAEASLASASSGCWPSERDTPRGFIFAPDLLAKSIGESRLRLGDLEAATAACEQAAALLDAALGPHAAMQSTVVPENQLILAAALAGRGELEGACKIAAESVSRYEGVAQAVITRCAKQLERRLAPYKSSPHTRELSELLRDRERELRAQSLPH